MAGHFIVAPIAGCQFWSVFCRSGLMPRKAISCGTPDSIIFYYVLICPRDFFGHVLF